MTGMASKPATLCHKPAGGLQGMSAVSAMAANEAALCNGANRIDMRVQSIASEIGEVSTAAIIGSPGSAAHQLSNISPAAWRHETWVSSSRRVAR